MATTPIIPLDSIAAQIQTPFTQAVQNPGLRQPDFPQGFEITEYIEGLPQPTLYLNGNLMPHIPFTWGGEQKLIKESYPGNPELAVQVLGGRESEVTINGRFKDKKYDGKVIKYGTSYQYALMCEGMRKRGNLVQFGMHGASDVGSGSWFRWGFVEHAEFKMNKLSFIDYTITFCVVSIDKPTNNFFSADSKTAPLALNTQLISQVTSFQSSYSAAPTTMPISIAQKINALVSDIATQITNVTSFVQTILTAATDAQNSITRAFGLIKNAKVTINSFRNQADNITHSYANMSTQGNAAGQASDAIKHTVYITESMASTVSLSQMLAQIEAQLQAIAKTLPKARYKVVDGDTLQNISVRFYNVSDNWKDIYDHNQLKTTVLLPGQVLEIPHL